MSRRPPKRLNHKLLEKAATATSLRGIPIDRGSNMKYLGWRPVLLVTACAAFSVTVSGGLHPQHPDDKTSVYKALDQHDLSSVNVSQDRESGVITLSGIVGSTDRQQRAQQLTQQAAPGYSIVNRIQVDNAGIQSEIQSETRSAHLDSSIEKHFKTELAASRMLKEQHIQSFVYNRTLTLKGSVQTYMEREEAEELAKKTPQVQHVVNEIRINNGKPSPANS
jgi:osmotically-inducible protein OsmY